VLGPRVSGRPYSDRDFWTMAVDKNVFPALVDRLVGPHMAKRGYHIAERSPRKVRYEGARVYFEFTNEPRDGDLGLYFGRLALEERFQFLLYLRSVAPAHPGARGALVESSDDVERELKNLADALRKHGQPILDGDDAVFDTMRNVRWWDFEPGVVREQ